MKEGKQASRGDVVADVLQLALQERNYLLIFNASFANFHGVNISTVTGFKQAMLSCCAQCWDALLIPTRS